MSDIFGLPGAIVPEKVKSTEGYSGGSPEYAKADHKHQLGALAEINGDPSLVINATNVLIKPSNRLYLGARLGYLPLAMQNVYQVSQAPIPAYLNFLGGAVNLDGKAGDMIQITYSACVYSSVVPHTVRAAFQIFGPGGNIITPDLVLQISAVAGYYDQISATYAMGLTLGDGVYTVAVIGGTQAGAGDLYIQSLSVIHQGIR